MYIHLVRVYVGTVSGSTKLSAQRVCYIICTFNYVNIRQMRRIPLQNSTNFYNSIHKLASSADF